MWGIYRPIYGLNKLLTFSGDPSTLRRLYRLLYGLVELLTVLGDPSTLWRLYRPLHGLVELLTVLLIRPLCGLLTSIREL